jgi:hypothetical protein
LKHRFDIKLTDAAVQEMQKHVASAIADIMPAGLKKGKPFSFKLNFGPEIRRDQKVAITFRDGCTWSFNADVEILRDGGKIYEGPCEHMIIRPTSKAIMRRRKKR